MTTTASTEPSTQEQRPTVETVWRELGASLQTFVRRRIADPHRADDLVGDILLRIHQNLHTVDSGDRLASWVFRIARNAVTDEYRRAARHRERLAADPGTDFGSDLVDEGGRPGEDADAEVLTELSKCLRPLLRQLPPHHRRAVELADLEGLSQVEAARREGISVSGMKSRVQRGRRQLRELVSACCALTLDARGQPIAYRRLAGCPCG